jgi:hypothetical protein
MNQKTTMTRFSNPEIVALTAATVLHSLLPNMDGYDGYDGTKECFDRLYQELYIIARDEVSLEIDPVDQVTETFFDYQVEISAGDRSFDWFE